MSSKNECPAISPGISIDDTTINRIRIAALTARKTIRFRVLYIDTSTTL